MHDRRVARLRARAAAQPGEAARLEAEADAAEAARAAGVSQWGSELPPDFLRMVLERLRRERRTTRGAIRATCSTWSSIFDAWCPFTLSPNRWTAVMEGKMQWFQSVTTVDLLRYERGIYEQLTELRSMPSLHTLHLPASCTERAAEALYEPADAEALYGLTTVTTLSFHEMRDIHDEDGDLVVPGEWVLDLSRMTALTSLDLEEARRTVKGYQLQAASELTGLTNLNLSRCFFLTAEGLRTLCRLTAIATLNLTGCDVKMEVLRAVSGLPALSSLDISHCKSVTAEELRTLSTCTTLSKLNLSLCNVTDEGLLAVSTCASLSSLDLSWCRRVTDAGLRTLNALAALTSLDLHNCVSVTEAGKQALRTALPKLTICG